MSRFFMYGTSLEGIEQLMMAAPNFSPRRTGIVINNYFNCEGGAAECNCYTDICFYLKEREADEIRYKDLIQDCFSKIKSYALKNRLKLFTGNFKGELFLNNAHKERFYNELHKQDIDINDISPRYIATLFLLTADDILWKLAEHSVRPNGFDFSQIHLKEINTDGYALYQTAKTISTGKEYISINEIADEDLINDTTFKAIINAALITRYGGDVFLITK
ncbi:hypothetical protein [Clostridium algidicarnis]|uniref:Uncharacterized protein n=1 Tax=Clostridium algidicarnis TaxID=37659 RepID=A0ABS6C4H5_9CLOT|nr:hypothetical protein [Clostridium algidicarnis]MBU3220368.1 hypothetical protein [Clostridium algidicarnis]